MEFEFTGCNLCGSDRAKVIGKRKSPDGDACHETNIVQCSSCGLFYPNPMPRLSNDEIQNNFNNPTCYFAKDIRSRLAMFEHPLDEIEKLRPRKGRILDVGCGRGEFLYAANKRGWEATGTDISESFVRYARNNFKVDALTGDLEKVELPSESFDAVSLISVIQYLQDPLATLKKINSLLKADGVLYIEVTNDDAFVFKIGDLFNSIVEGKRVTTRLSPLFPSYQIYGFNKRALSTALRVAGFRISSIKIGGIFGGGSVRGNGLGNTILNLIRKGIIFTGGASGNGHLIFCTARKEGKL